MKIVLASSSAYRKSQLATLGIPFECISPEIDETPIPDEQPASLASRLARQKALTISHKMTVPTLVIGSDQTACCDGKLFGKPGTYQKAFEQLAWLSGKKATFYSAVALHDSRNNDLHHQVTETIVHYRKLSALQIEHYLATDKPFDCAGSFKCESLGIAILASVCSNDPSALVGLPLIALTTMLAEAGLDVLA